MKINISKYVPKASSIYNVELMNNESTRILRTKLHTRTTRALNHANNELNDKTIDQICHCLKRSETIFIYGFGASFVVATTYTKSYQEWSLILRTCSRNTYFCYIISNSQFERQCYSYY